MRIAHVTATFPPYPGGTGIVCYYNALGMAKRGHDVTVFTADYPPGDCEYPPEITIKRLPFLFRMGNAPFLPGLLKIDHFDIIHLHHPFIFGAEMIWALSRLRRIPYVFTHHNDLIGEGNRRLLFEAYSRVSTQFVFGGASRVITVNKDHAAGSLLHRLFRKNWEIVCEIPNAVDTQLFRPELNHQGPRKQYSIPKDAKVVLFVGALDRAHHYRRVDLLIKAVEKLHDHHVYLILVGDGDKMDDYQRVVEICDLGPRVHFVGRVLHQNLPGLYGVADVVVLPSMVQESFGMVLIEAMACGKPVIASDLPGVRIVVSDGEDGFLVEAGNVDQLTARLRILLDDPQKASEMGRRGRAKVEEKYAWPVVTQELERVYQAVLSDSRTSNDNRDGSGGLRS